MSWFNVPNLSFRFLRRGLVVSVATLSLSGCFTPLYGPNVQGGAIKDRLAQIAISFPLERPDQVRLRHALKTELAYLLDPSGSEADKRFTLDITLAESIQSAVVDTSTGRADTATITADATYVLSANNGTTRITAGKATMSASYDRTVQRFASLRAAQDAERRIAQQLADQLRTRIALAFVTQP